MARQAAAGSSGRDARCTSDTTLFVALLTPTLAELAGKLRLVLDAIQDVVLAVRVRELATSRSVALGRMINAGLL
jgi:hypothetical protein